MVVGSPDGVGVGYLAMFEGVISCKVRGECGGGVEVEIEEPRKMRLCE